MGPFTPARARWAVAVGATAVQLVLAAGIAWGASPVAGGAYRGTLPDGLNNGRHWNYAPEVTGTAAARISASGTEIARFSGSYFYYCGAGRSTLTGRSIAISARGTFYSTAKAATRYGINYYMLSGHFLDRGHKVAISYLDDFVSTGAHVANPYSTVFRQGPCESWVHGTLNLTRSLSARQVTFP